MGRMALGVLVLLAYPMTSQADDSSPVELRLRQATVVLMPWRCAGALVGRADQVLTAAHCVERLGEPQQVHLPDGQEIEGRVTALDPQGDIAIIQLERPAPGRPLELASALPAPGDEVFFAGRADHGTRFQQARVKRLGRCPSLPSLFSAIFTDIEGQKGDSGAPLVDRHQRVVGLVHGGAACSIAAPVAISPLAALVATPTAQGRRRLGGSSP